MKNACSAILLAATCVVLVACGTEPLAAPAAPELSGAVDIVLDATGDGASGLIFQVRGAEVDSAVGGAAFAGVMTVSEDGATDVAVAGDRLRRGVIARLFLAAPRSPADVDVQVVEVVGGEALQARDANAYSLTVRPASGGLATRALPQPEARAPAQPVGVVVPEKGASARE